MTRCIEGQLKLGVASTRIVVQSASISPEIAAMLLAKIDEHSPHSEPIPQLTEMPTTSELTQVLNAAQDLRRQFQSAKVYPLHLLAAALGDPSSKASQVLRDAGISQEMVLEALQKD